MRAFVGTVGLLLTLGTVYFLYQAQTAPVTAQAPAPAKKAMDAAAVTTDLLSIAQAERIYAATHGTYGTLDQLRESGAISFGSVRHGYSYQATVDGGRSFRITAQPADPARANAPSYSIDQTLQVTPRYRRELPT